MMNSASERRKFERFQHSAPIIFVLRGSDQFVDAELRDFCRGGMGFLTGAPVEPDSEIYIMTEHYSPDTIGAEIYDGYLARVCWCEPLTKSQKARYRVGVQYPVTGAFGGHL